VSVLQARLGHSLPGPLDHLRREIYSDNSPLRSNLASSQDDVYPPSATEIHHYIAGFKAREAGGVTATSGEVESDLWNQGKLFLTVEPLFYRVARTGLPLARSDAPCTACFSEFAVAGSDQLSRSAGAHTSYLLATCSTAASTSSAYS